MASMKYTDASSNDSASLALLPFRVSWIRLWKHLLWKQKSFTFLQEEASRGAACTCTSPSQRNQRSCASWWPPSGLECSDCGCWTAIPPLMLPTLQIQLSIHRCRFIDIQTSDGFKQLRFSMRQSQRSLQGLFCLSVCQSNPGFYLVKNQENWRHGVFSWNACYEGSAMPNCGVRIPCPRLTICSYTARHSSMCRTASYRNCCYGDKHISHENRSFGFNCVYICIPN